MRIKGTYAERKEVSNHEKQKNYLWTGWQLSKCIFYRVYNLNFNKTGLQPVSGTCRATPFGFQESRRKKKRTKRQTDRKEWQN